MLVDPPKIGLVYKEKVPQLLLEASNGELPWIVQPFSENAILGGPVHPSRDYLAVLFPYEPESAETLRHLSNLFPGAEMVGYRVSDKDRGGLVSRSEDGLLLFQLPMPAHLFRVLMEGLSTERTQRRALIAAQRRADDIKDFFDAFANTVDSSSSISDRKLGMSLLINKILFHIRAEECMLYLFGEGGGILQRAYSTGNIKDLDLFEQHARGHASHRDAV